MTKKVSFYSLKSSSKKQGLPKVIKNKTKIYDVDYGTKSSYTPVERAQGIAVLTELCMDTYINFMGGIKV